MKMKNMHNNRAKIEQRARFGSLCLIAGVGGMLASLSEQSNVWATYVFLTGWIGISIGIMCGFGYSEFLHGRIPPHRQFSAASGCFLSLITFWGPCLAIFVASLIVAKTLPDATRPQSSLDGKNMNIMLQSAVMYFNALGCTWLIVWLDSRRTHGNDADKKSTPVDEGLLNE